MLERVAYRITRNGANLDCVAERPANALARCIGLIGHPPLRPDEGMWLDRASAIHTFWMKTPIDVVFIDRARHIVRLEAGVPPWRFYVGARSAVAVLELSAGSIARLGLREGDVLAIESVTP